MVESLFGEDKKESGSLTLEGNKIEYEVIENETITLTITDESGGTTTITVPIGDFLLSSCASKNVLEGGGIPNIVIKKSSILDLQSEELKNLPGAKRKPVIAIYPNSFMDHTGPTQK